MSMKRSFLESEMSFIRRAARIAAWTAAGCLLAYGTPQTKPPASSPRTKIQLPTHQRDFLQLVTYIITPSEKDVFDKLADDRDRDIFIESFWKFRDPTPGTPENEFREEHVRRFNYANTTLGRGAGRPGWMTDRGRFYIILGEPNSYDRYPNSIGLVPCEVWYYYTDSRKGLPLHFGLVFFQKAGTGEYKLYDPAVDGPKALMFQTREVNSLDPMDYEGLYEKIEDQAPALAGMSISLIPGEYGYGYQPSPRNTILIAQILESPRADIKPTYATHFLDYKGLVSTEYMSNFVETETSVALIQDPVLDIPFIHFSMKPTRLSVDYAEVKDQYYCAFTISVSLRVPDKTPEELIYQYTKDLPYYFGPNEVERVRANGLAIEDSFPVAAGTYRLIILLQNAVAKEFSVYEKDIVIPADDGALGIAGPFFGYRFQDYGLNVHVPFKVLEKKLILDPKNTFARQDTVATLFNVQNVGPELRKEGTVRTSIRGISGKSEARKTLTVRLRDLPTGKVIPITQSFPARDLPPEYYEVEVEVLDGRGLPVATAKGQFVLSPLEAVGHPISRAKGFPLENKYALYGILAQQYAKSNDPVRAEAFYQKALSLKPDFARGFADYAQFLVKSGKFDEAIATAEKFKGDASLQFEYPMTRGRALVGKGLYSEAIESLLAANRVYNSDTGVLNALGFCYFKLGKKKEALDALHASLKLNPGQSEAKTLLAEVEKLK